MIFQSLLVENTRQTGLQRMPVFYCNVRFIPNASYWAKPAAPLTCGRRLRNLEAATTIFRMAKLLEIRLSLFPELDL